MPSLLLSGYFFFKGAKATAFISSVLVPAMALGYLLVALFVIFSNIEKLPMIFSHVFEEAFNFEAIFSGFAGSAIVCLFLSLVSIIRDILHSLRGRNLIVEHV